MKFVNTFEQRPDIIEELRKGQRDISEENITLKVTHHRLRSAWITPLNPEGQADDAVVVFYCKLKTNVIDIVDNEAKTEKILTIELLDDKIKCTMKSCCNQDVYDSKFECTYNDKYTYHEELCDAMESWEFEFEKDNMNNVVVYRAIPSADGGYSLSAEYNGSVEITQYDNAGNPTMRTYGRAGKKQHGRYKIQICPIREMYLIAQYVNLDNAAVIMCSSYPIDKEKVSKIKNKLLLEFDDITNKNALSAFNDDKGKMIKAFVDSLGQDVKALYICCDSGESRSTAIGAAVMRYTKMSDMDIWKNPYYHPNPFVYRLQCKSFGISVSKFEVRRKVHINEKALRNYMKKK